MQIVQIQWEAELVYATLDMQVSGTSVLLFFLFSQLLKSQIDSLQVGGNR